MTTLNGTKDETYLKTHPWLTFKADLRKVFPDLWIMLGECQSKCEHIASVPLRPDTADRLHKIYLARGVLATTAIEGNTLSEAEVRAHLEGKLKLPPSRDYLKEEIENIIQICNRLLKDVSSGTLPAISFDAVCALNQGILKNLDVDEEVVPGEIRTHTVGVGRYACPPASECRSLLDQLCRWLNSDVFKSPTSRNRTVYAIIKAVLAHLYIAWIHPFGDGNGRTARLLEFQILISSGVPAPAAHLLSNHYNLTRSEYYRQLDRASKSGF